MPVFHASGRLDEMRRLGISEPLVRLAAGEVLHPLFEIGYVGPPAYVYRDWIEEEYGFFPGGPMFVPFWSFADCVQGCWEVAGGLEFIDLHIEDPDNPRILARTEQGFLAWMFAELHESHYEPVDFDQLPEAAKVVGYRHWAEYCAAFDAAHLDDNDTGKAFDAAFIAQIDSLKTSRDRRRR